MSNQVYANNMEISCKQAAGKSICAFPDVCMTPPQTPATPPGVPIPYPNTGMASDTTDGSSSVKVSGQEVMLKDKSYFKKSMGDEAGCAPMKGVMSHKTMGKVYFIVWSMDVKAEGENVVRHLDLTTHNHGSNPNEAIPFPYLDAMAALQKFDSCKAEADNVKKQCVDNKDPPQEPCPAALGMPIMSTISTIKGRLKSKGVSKPKGLPKLAAAATTVAGPKNKKSACTRALRCLLRPYDGEKDGISKGCCPGQTPHHIPPYSTTKPVKGMSVSKGKALCVCLEGANHSVGSHGKHHHGINFLMREAAKTAGSGITGGPATFKGKLSEHIKIAAAVTEAQNGCSKECIEEQLNGQYKPHLDKQATHSSANTGGTGLMDADSGAQSSALVAMQRPPVAPTISV
jgi:Domain of unknown function (DUF4150)/GHH signature containing HNH/Endo VII superfamily nuclease toxin  2